MTKPLTHWITLQTPTHHRLWSNIVKYPNDLRMHPTISRIFYRTVRTDLEKEIKTAKQSDIELNSIDSTFWLILILACFPEIRWTDGGQDFCIIDGKPYRSGDRIPRDHPCHVCMCHMGRASCYWMKCPPAPEGCIEYTDEKYCNPALYVCGESPMIFLKSLINWHIFSKNMHIYLILITKQLC